MRLRILDYMTLKRPANRGLRTARHGRVFAALAVCAAVLLALLAARPSSAQFANQQTRPPINAQQLGQRADDEFSHAGISTAAYDRFLRERNADRQKSLVVDTNRLLRLVNELNAEIVRVNTGSLTPEQLRKVVEIEKLAHNVKDKMSASIREAPVFETPFQAAHH